MKLIFKIVQAVAIAAAVAAASPFLAVFGVICLGGVSKSLGGINP